jgi:hypothetical protein
MDYKESLNLLLIYYHNYKNIIKKNIASQKYNSINFVVVDFETHSQTLNR